MAPVIKVVTNPNTYNKMPDDFDVNAGRIVDGEKTITEVGKEIFNLLLEVINGKQTRAEVNKQCQFAIRQESFHWPKLKDIAERGL
ncbi:hypothetical protein ACFLS8_05425 [Chloroflexota bacterium]